MSEAQRITAALGGKWRNGRGLCRCVCHDDRTPSMSINDGDKEGRVLVKCFAGCNSADVIAEFRRRGWLDDKSIIPVGNNWTPPPRARASLRPIGSRSSRCLPLDR